MTSRQMIRIRAAVRTVDRDVPFRACPIEEKSIVGIGGMILSKSFADYMQQKNHIRNRKKSQ